MADEWTVIGLLQWTRQFFEKKGIDTPRLDAEVLLAHVLDTDRFHLYAGFDRKPTQEQLARYRELVRLRSERCPTQYLVGRCEFYSLAFKVTRDVLVPRPETEHLVEAAIRLAGSMQQPVIVDIGTGSGCIAICAAVKCPTAKVYATDISPAALSVAGENAAAHGVAERIRLLVGDLFAALDGLGLEGNVNVLVSNPPYVSEGDLAAAMPEVRDWEPRVALCGGPDGLDVIRRIVAGAGRFIAPGGWLLLEIGAGQGEAVRRIVAEHLPCEQIDLLPDLQKVPRVLAAKLAAK